MQIRVVACVVSRDNQLLVCQRPFSKRHGGLWEFPGGKVEQGESDEEAARRELREELGVELESTSDTEFTRADPDSPFLIAFVPVEIKGVPKCHEHTDLRWGTAEELASLPLAPSDREFVNYLIEKS